MSKKIRVRFPPSPTGYLHIGSLRTALYNYAFAKKHGGEFVLRIEDTDRNRYVPGGEEALIRVLDRVEITYDEGPRMNKSGEIYHDGESGPYIQSERLDIYREFVDKLIEDGHAYRCFCTKERLDEMRKQQQALKQPTKYDRHCLNLSEDEVNKKLQDREPSVVRLKIPEGETTFNDIIRGKITISNTEIDDQVILKSDNYPTYHMAVVVDDHLMGVTHIIRGEEWISSVPKHVLLYNLLGFDLPEFAHLPLLLNEDRSKLSKRQGDVAVEDYLNKGYLPEALLNFVALLGYNPKGDQEIYNMDEYAELFDLSKVNSGGAVVNFEKLDWLNGQYIRSLSAKELITRSENFLIGERDMDENLLERIVEVEKGRLVTLAELQEKVDLYKDLPSFSEPDLLVWKKSDARDAAEQLRGILKVLSDADESIFGKVESIETFVREYINSNELQNGNVLWPLRVALSGQKNSPSPFELLWVFKKDASIERINHALNVL